MSTNIGFIGGGNMATSLIGGLCRSDQDAPLVQAEQIWVFDKSADKTQTLKSNYGINVAASNDEMVICCDILVLAVKPQILETVLTPLVDSFAEKQPLLVSVVAGIKSVTMERWLGRELPIIRVMPNTPALVAVGASGLYANARVSEEQKRLTVGLLDATGLSAWVDNEADIDSVTALSGSGPAYFMLFIQSLIDAGVQAGIEPETAKTLAVQTAVGAAELIRQSDNSIATLIDNVTSAGGTTEQALISFREAGLPGIVADAFTAAKTRSEEMATELDT
ncbi:MAG: pyrroline-5-carboxylate reductase [Pseudomonadota bacterium]